MFDIFCNVLFPGVVETSIVLDGILYIPVETVIGTVGGSMVLYGFVLGAAAFFIWQLLDLLKTLFELVCLLIKRRIQKKKAASEDSPEA